MQSHEPPSPPSSQPPARQSPLILVPVAIFLAAMVLVAFIWFGGRNDNPFLDPEAEPRVVSPRSDLLGEENARIELFNKASKSVVFVTTAAVGRDLNLNQMEVPKGSGTGFMWDDKGHIVTNFHVVEAANRWQVKLSDQSTWEAILIGAAPDRDLAVLKIEAPKSKLHPIQLGESHNLQVGQSTLAIGNPFGLGQTLTTGVISGLGREIKARTGVTIRGVIQTDAAINPGNSGGPLLDSAGRMIGVNTAIYSPSGTSAGIGFAIPVDSVNRTVPLILRRGLIVRPVLGVQVGPDQLMEKLGLEGVMVIGFPESSPAKLAGMKALRRDDAGNELLGDIIIEIDGKKISKLEDLLTVLADYEPGKAVKVTVLRDAKTDNQQEVEMRITLIAPH